MPAAGRKPEKENVGPFYGFLAIPLSVIGKEKPARGRNRLAIGG